MDTGRIEVELWKGRPSLAIFGWRWGVALLLTPVGIGLLYGLWLWLSARSTEYTVTSQRLIWARGVLNRRQDQVEFYRVRDVSLVQPWWMRPFGVGNVVIWSSDITTPNDALLAVKDPQAVFNIVREAVESLRRGLGIRALDVETR